MLSDAGLSGRPKTREGRAAPGLATILLLAAGFLGLLSSAGLFLLPELGLSQVAEAGILRLFAFLILLLALASLSAFLLQGRRLAAGAAAQARFAAVFDGVDRHVLLVNPQGCILQANASAKASLGQADPRGKLFWDSGLCPPEAKASFLEALEAALAGEKRPFEVGLGGAGPGSSRLSFSIVAPESLGRKPPFLVVEGGDVTELRAKEERIRALAYLDQTTGLPNRASLEEDLGLLLHRGPGQSRAVAVIDVGNLRYVNNTFGQNSGDELLRSFASRLGSSLPPGSLVARLGGGTFAAVLEDGPGCKDFVAAAESSLAALREPFSLGDQRFHVSARLGLATYPEHGKKVSELVGNAEAAMHRARGLRTDHAALFSDSMIVEIRERLVLEEALRAANFFDNVRLHFQPQYSTLERRLLGYEALIRWHDPVLGFVSPLRFIPLAEETGLIVGIGYWAIGEARRFAERLARAGRPELTVAVNVSPVQLLEASFVEKALALVASPGLRPSSLVFEITESSLMEAFDAAVEKLTALRAAGHGVHLDDFGTGFSSLSYLRSLPLDALKLDKSFVDEIEGDLKARSIVGSMIEVAHELGLEVVAEGVEKVEQMSILRFYGCDAIQGWLLGKALPDEEALAVALADGPAEVNIS